MRKDVSITKGIAAGFVAGLVASWVMNQFQAAMGKLMEGPEKSHGAQSQQSGTPDHGAGAILKERGADNPDDNAAERSANFLSVAVLDKALSENQKQRGGTIFHYAFGASTGALYGAASELTPMAKVGLGLPFGLGVWAVADEFVVPGLGLSKSAAQYPLSVHGYSLASHLVYGLTTELTHRFTRAALG